jgi:hypothetical protein
MGDFATAAVAAKNANSIGFCLLSSDYGAFDIAHCRDAADGAIDAWAKALVATAGSYVDGFGHCGSSVRATGCKI